MNIAQHSITNLICNQYVKFSYLEQDFTGVPRPFSSLAYVLRGTLECVTESYTVTAHEGDILYIPFRTRYLLRYLGDSAIYSCHFNFPPFSEPFGTKNFQLQKISGHADKKKDFEYIFEHVSQKEHTLGVLGTFYLLCHELCPLLTYQNVAQLDERIKRSVDYINANYLRDISIEELARVSRMSVSRFYYCFKNATGMTAIEYKNSMCVKHASFLLVGNEDLSIEEISEASGFQSADYFRRVFKSYTGQSPREYRKSMKTAL